MQRLQRKREREREKERRDFIKEEAEQENLKSSGVEQLTSTLYSGVKVTRVKIDWVWSLSVHHYLFQCQI